jgi:hypothetical protein
VDAAGQCVGGSVRQLGFEEGARRAGIALDRRAGQPGKFSDLVDVQSAEEAQLYDPHQSWIEIGEPSQRRIDAYQALGLGFDRERSLAESVERARLLPGATTLGQLGAGVVDHDLSHRLCSGGVVVTAARERVAARLQLEVGLVHQCARVERRTPAVARKFGPRQSHQVGIHRSIGACGERR